MLSASQLPVMVLSVLVRSTSTVKLELPRIRPPISWYFDEAESTSTCSSPDTEVPRNGSEIAASALP